MALADLTVLNRESPGDTSPSLLPNACVIGTCLRDVRIGMLPPDDQPLPAEASVTGHELHTGADAYGFLLQLACGLESEIAGETEILGQVKQAWRDCETSGGDMPRLLRPWMQRLLQDAKEIRSEYVVGLGSTTYGSLVRRLLGGASHGPTLLLGAGQLAETVLPFLDTGEVLVWNRSHTRAAEMLSRQRVAQTQDRVHLLNSSVAAEEAAWHRARDVVICIPADAMRDPARVQWWQHHGAPHGQVLHLGIDSTEGTAWSRAGKVATLRDLFGLRDSQATQREALLARARKACADKAQLARLDDADGSRAGSSNHGWEDLAVFQAFSY